MSIYLVYDRTAQNLLSPGTAPIRFDTKADAKLHLRRLDRADVEAGRYQVIKEP
jgi:hypothetical protein